MDQTSRGTVLVAVLVILTVASIGGVGATIDSAVGTSSDDQPVGESREIGGDPTGPNITLDAANGSGGGVQQRQSISLSFCVRLLTNLGAVFGIVLAVVGIVFLSYRRYNASAALLVGTSVVPTVWLFYFLFTNCGSGGSGGGGGLLSSAAVVSNKGGIQAVSVSPIAAVAVFSVLVIAGVVVLFRATGDEEEFVPPGDETAREAETGAFAAAAGRAADRIEKTNDSVDNAVYQAWIEMTGLLDIDNPESTSPRGFAHEAIQTGLSEPDVAELTELFNEVRYGDKPPDDREDRAVEVLRNIEETYAETGADTGTDATGAGEETDATGGDDR